MTHQNITLRVPVELVARIDAEVVAEAKRTGLRIDRSQIIRRVLTQVLPELKEAAAKKVAGK
jgi:hypothetical protein